MESLIMKNIILIIVVLFSNQVFCQNLPNRLTIGDTIPDIEITNVINYKTTSIKLSNFRGKLLILDFWAIWCSGCINGFSKLDSFQKKFPDQLQVMLINDEGERSSIENEKKTKAFFTNLKSKTNGLFALPSSLKRVEVLNQLFPHIYIPHYVWISSQGKVIAVTSSEEVTEINIRAAINRIPNKMPLKTL